MTADILDELRWRGLIAQSTDDQALAKQLRSPTTIYCGFDPTAESLHAGNFLQLMTLRRFQLAGHRPIALAGGATGLIGDPSGRSSERDFVSHDQVAARLQRIQPQLERLLDFESGALLANNLDWTEQLPTLDFLRDIGKHFSVNVMLARESVSARLEGSGISFTEFSYTLLQSLDYLELFRRYDCRIQTGGSDQWGNIVAGLDLIRRVEGATVHALTTPLVTSSSGEKFGKSTGGGRLWLDPELTSPYSFFQYWVNVDDRDVGRYLRYFTFLDREEVESLDAETGERPAARTAQRRLAEELTRLVHGQDETRRVIAASTALFGRGDLAGLDEATLTAALLEAPHSDGELRLDATVVDMLVATGLCSSVSDARRTVEQGGAWINNERWDSTDRSLTVDDLLAGRWVVVRKGKRAVAGVRPAG